jgi:hypothetical protein
MKKHFLVYHALLFFVISGTLLAHDKEYEQIECTLIPITRHIQAEDNSCDCEYVSLPRIPSTRLPENQSTSTNWSGYVAANSFTSPTTGSVTAVSGTWVVPTVVPVCNDTYSAYWVGIDGFLSPTVEQTGTAHDFVNGAPNYYAWFEMYPNGSFLISGFPVNPGDVISASVTYVGSNVFNLTIINETENVSFTAPTSSTTMAGTLRNSAEWIVEAPYSGGILPLSDFVTASVRNGMTTINGITGPIQDANWQDTDVIMEASGVTKAVPTALLEDNASFFVVWKHQ